MRVLQASDNYPPARGGLERVVAALAGDLIGRGHDVHVATLSRPDAAAEAVEDGIPVHRLDGMTRHLRRLAADPGHQFHPTSVDPLLLPRLQRLVDEIEPEIVHAHGWMLSSCLALRLPPGARLVTTLHDYGVGCATKTMTRAGVLDAPCPGPSLRRCLPCATATYGALKGPPLVLGLTASGRHLDRVALFLAVSQAVADLSPARVSRDRVRVVPAFVPDDTAAAADAPRPAFLPPGDVVLFVGALAPHKGVDTLLAAHRLLPRGTPLVLIGPRRADTPPLDGGPDHPVVVLEDVPHDEIMAAFAAAAVAVVPSRWPEPHALVAIEAMAAGTPVVASAVGGLTALFDGVGVLVPPGDAAALAAAVTGLLSDPERRARLAAAGRARAAAFTASEVVPRVIAAYDEALALPAPPGVRPPRAPRARARS